MTVAFGWIYPRPVYVTGMTLSFNIILVVLILPSNIAPSCSYNNSIFNRCDSREGGHAIKVPTEISCSLPPNSLETAIEVKVHLWGHRSVPQETTAIRCVVKINYLCTNMGLFRSHGITAQYEEYTIISNHECLFARKTKTYKHKKLQKLGPRKWATTNLINMEYRWCCFDFCKNMTNLIIDQGVISTFDGLTLLSDLGQPTNCSLSERVCFLEHATIRGLGKNPWGFFAYTYML